MQRGIDGKPMTLWAAHKLLSEMTLARPGYSPDGRTINMIQHASMENMYEEEDNPGRAICAEYTKLFGHLYK